YCALRVFLNVVIPNSPLISPVGVDTQILESGKTFAVYQNSLSVTSLFMVKAISLNVNSTGMIGKKRFGLSGLSRVTGSSLRARLGDEGFCEDDSAIRVLKF
ncbi:hypothetical protein Tco_1034238, partial [Tanacetum coccineum]